MLTTTRVILYRFLIGANVTTIVMLWFCAVSVYIYPSFLTWLPFFGLLFPFFLGVNIFFLLMWLLFRWRTCWLPLLGLLGCAGSIRTYCPINFSHTVPEGSIKVLSYNVMSFGGENTDEHGRNEVAQYMLKSNADIICFQEGGTTKVGYWNDKVKKVVTKMLPYCDTIHIGTGGDVLGCFSRYKILSCEQIPVDTKTKANGSACFRLLIGGDTVSVINNHLESNALSHEDRQCYKDMIKEPSDTTMKKGTNTLFKKITKAGVVRAAQARTIRKWIEEHKPSSIILCGDFNDSPISYTRYEVGAGLKDAFARTGNGIGISFNRDGIIVRIDHIFCSDDWKPYAAKVDRSILASDHYPISCYLKRVKR